MAAWNQIIYTYTWPQSSSSLTLSRGVVLVGLSMAARGGDTCIATPVQRNQEPGGIVRVVFTLPSVADEESKTTWHIYVYWDDVPQKPSVIYGGW